MQMWEIVLSFKNCNGDERISFKDYFEKMQIDKDELAIGSVITGSYNYILSDIEKLINKSIINIISSHLLNKNGLISWGYVTSYYANYFLFQALNRLHLKFITYSENLYSCNYVNYLYQELEIKKSDTEVPKALYTRQ